MKNCPPGSIGTYPLSDWSDELVPADVANPPPVVYFRGVELQLPDPAALVDELGIDECQHLMGLIELRAPMRSRIGIEATRVYQGMAWVLAAAGVSTDIPYVNLDLKDLRKFIDSEIEGPILKLKWKFNRARPWTCCGPELAPIFVRPHWLYPGHPSYPSGTATSAWVVAYLVGHLVPKYQAALERAAAQVALNREIAGVHYPSDSEAGKRLARQLVDIMLTQTDEAYEKQFATIKKWVT
jgi:hypothetical protein